jgi:threonine/homoserine/homoserine lactone efflux protein
MNVFADLGIVHPGFFCAAVLLLNLTPGPDTAFIVGQSVAHGRRAGMMSVLGISAGCGVHTLALAFGLSALIAASANAFMLIKIVGAAYLIFLGVRMIIGTLRTHGGRNDPSVPNATPSSALPKTAAQPSARRTFAQGFATNVLNPKVVLFFLSFFPQFVSSGSPSKGLAFAVLGGVLIVISTIYNGAVAWLAGSITHRMRGAPRVRAWLERSVGTAFVALGARLVLSER